MSLPPNLCDEFLRVFDTTVAFVDGIDGSFNISLERDAFLDMPSLLKEKPGLSLRPWTWLSSLGDRFMPYWPGPGTLALVKSCVTLD